VKVAFYQYEDVMERNMFLFRGCNAQFLNMLVVALREMYLMPGETVIQQRDMSRELIFVRSGSLELLKNSQLIKTVRADSDLPSVVGEVPFFMSIGQPYTVKARTTSDATCLMLSKLDFEELKMHYPEQQDIIVTNILTQFDLNKDGTNALHLRSKEDDDPERAQMREQIQGALLKRYADSLSNVTYAASEGDVDTVHALLKRGLPVDSSDYDFRTTLHLAAVEGNLKVVEALIDEGANVNVKDRWGQTPLQDAVNMGHGQVIEMLQKNGGKLDYDDPSGALCGAASRGDLKMMKQLIDNGIDPNCGDYDARSAFHLSAAEGKLKVVDYLLSVGANSSIEDRWGGTPLEDAVKSGQEVCAMLLLHQKAKLRLDFIANALCVAAAEGDLNLLRMLVTAGGHVDSVDYDSRTALHLASVEGQLLTVDFLVNTCHSDINLTDRWQSTAFQDALNSDHVDVAVMLLAAGAVLGSSGDPELLKKLENAPSIAEVHRKVAHLARRFHGRGWKLRGSTEMVRRNDQGDNVFLGRIIESAVKFMPQLKQSYSAMNDHLVGVFGQTNLPIVDTSTTSAKPTCALVRQGRVGPRTFNPT
jgi:ankyrin repeat protein